MLTKLTGIALAITIMGCQQQYVRMDQPQTAFERVHTQCQYEAEKATAGIINGFEAGWKKGDIMRKCMEINGYKAR